MIIELQGRGMGRIGRFLESDYGFYRISTHEIMQDGNKKNLYWGAHYPLVLAYAESQALFETEEMLKADKNVIVEQNYGRIDVFKKFDTLPTEVLLWANKEIHGLSRTKFFKYRDYDETESLKTQDEIEKIVGASITKLQTRAPNREVISAGPYIGDWWLTYLEQFKK